MVRTGWQKTWIRVTTSIITASVIIMIFCFSAENAEESNKRSSFFANAAVKVFYPDYDRLEPIQQLKVYDEVQYTVRKCAHFTEYLLLGFTLRLCLESWIGNRILRSGIMTMTGTGSGILVACTDEAHQLITEGRIGSWTDVLLDGSGVITGLILGIQAVRFLSMKR